MEAVFPKTAKSCGIILFTADRNKFLLMKHEDRWDIPKGHIERGETDLDCALREFAEETGLNPDDIILDKGFLYVDKYPASYKRFNFRTVEKTLIVFLAYIDEARQIVPTEHIGYSWFDWAPPHEIESKTVDKLLACVARYYNGDKLA